MYNAERLTQILTGVAEIIGATVLNVAREDYEPQGASVTILIAEQDGDTYHIDVREIVEDGHDVDAVKVLGAGQVRNELSLVADDFSESAREKVEAAGGETELTERGQERQSRKTDNESDEE